MSETPTGQHPDRPVLPGPDELEGLDDADLAVALVTGAGGLAARMRAEGLDVEQKTSVSDLVTTADHAAEAYVVDTLARVRPDDGVLGEEGSSRPGSTGRTWVIDPVDGTYNFASGLDYWCSALALTDPSGTVLGAVHRPATGETWLGGRDRPATRDARVLAPLVDQPADLVSLATYIHPGTIVDPDVLEPWLALVRGVATPRLLGSGSVDLASVASGRIGAWAQHSPPPWDWLPGQALVESAGGTTAVVTHRGHDWHLAGNRRTVGELRSALLGS